MPAPLPSRRSVFRGALGVAALPAAPGLLASCGSGSADSGSGGGSTSGSTSGSSGSSGSGATGEVTLGSNASDAVPKAALEKIVTSYQQQSKGVTIKINTIDHNTFQERINNYLQGQPDDVLTWFSGFRMRFFAKQGPAGDISGVWKNLSGFSDALKEASTADGKQYFVPSTTYPWAVYYRPSVFKAKGCAVPKTMRLIHGHVHIRI